MANAGVLSKSRSVLDLAYFTAFTIHGTAIFRQPDDGDAADFIEHRMSKQRFVDLGSPKQITVTIVPGDQLNEGAP